MRKGSDTLQGVGRLPLGFELPRGRTLPHFRRKKVKGMFWFAAAGIAANVVLLGAIFAVLYYLLH